MSRREIRVLAALALVAVMWAMAYTVAGLGQGLELLAPALVFALPLLAGRYLGEDVIDRARLARAVPPPRRRARAVTAVRPRPPRRPVLRGGLLLAANLAHRPPPALG
jgi:hypothetical protein